MDARVKKVATVGELRSALAAYPDDLVVLKKEDELVGPVYLLETNDTLAGCEPHEIPALIMI